MNHRLPIDELAAGGWRGAAAGTRIHPKVREHTPQKPPEIIDTTWNYVAPFDHVAEGRAICVIAWDESNPPGTIRATIATPVFIDDDPDHSGLWRISWEDPEVDTHTLDQRIRVIRGIVLSPPTSWGINPPHRDFE